VEDENAILELESKVEGGDRVDFGNREVTR